MKKYYLSDVMEIANVKRNTLNGWIRSGYVWSSIGVANGLGTQNVWALEDIARVIAFKKLVAVGFTHKSAGRMLNEIDD